VLDRATAFEGYRAVTHDGRVLQADAGLAAQRVQDGDIIAISASVDDQPPSLHDDVVEAVARAVEGVEPRDQAPSRWVCLGAAVPLLLIGAPALLSGHGNGSAASFGAALAGLLLTTAFVFSRRRGDTVAGATAAYLGCVYAAVAGLCSSWHASLTDATAAQSGGCLMVTGVIAALALAERCTLMLPAVVVGAVVLAAGWLTHVSHLDAAPFLTGLLTFVVITGGALPGMALSATGVGRHASSIADEVPGCPSPLDMGRVRAEVSLAREILVAASVTTGALLGLLAPFAVSLGPAGCAVPILGCAAVMLRTRRYRAAVDVVIGIGSGVLGIVSTVGSMLWLDGRWPLVAGMVVAAAGVAVLAAALRLPLDMVRRGRLGDLVECAALGMLLPALLLAIGLSLEKP
jgi:hypothetical protein